MSCFRVERSLSLSLLGVVCVSRGVDGSSECPEKSRGSSAHFARCIGEEGLRLDSFPATTVRGGFDVSFVY